jgi:chromosome segregation ATPase
MPLKSNRGIQQEDVALAADALVTEGLRPTIERVRQKIGRGSPNTVSPLLDAWFATLGSRLGVDGAREEGASIPEPVRQAASALWEAALASAREEAQRALAQAHAALAAQGAELTQKETEFEHQKLALLERQRAADGALQVANSQLGDMADRLEEAGASLSRRERDIDALGEKLSALEAQRDAALRRSEEEARRHAEERTRLESRAMANERRLLEELDRERQEAKRLKAMLTEQESRAVATQARLEAASQRLATSLHERARELKEAQQAKESANDLLEAQKEAHAITLKQFELLVANTIRKKPLARPLVRRRRI